MVSRKTFDVVESGLFNDYPWGKDVFYHTLDFLKGKVGSKGKKKPDGTFYRLNGFPYALQVWFYESCCFGLANLCFHNPGKIPRILNWGCNLSPSFKVLKRTVFKDSLKKVKFYIFVYFMFLFCF